MDIQGFSIGRKDGVVTISQTCLENEDGFESVHLNELQVDFFIEMLRSVLPTKTSNNRIPKALKQAEGE